MRNETYDTNSKSSSTISYHQSPQYHHHHHNHQVLPHNSMNISQIGLPMHCNLTTAPTLQQQQHQALTQCPATTTCFQHQPIHNQIYQSLQTYHPSSFQPTFFSPDNSMATSIPQRQQHLSVNTNRHYALADIDPQLNYNLNLQQRFQPNKSASTLGTISQSSQEEKLSILPSHFVHNSSPTVTATSSAVGTITSNDNNQWRATEGENNHAKTTTNQRSKLVESSNGDSSSSSFSTPKSKLKSYLTHLVLASNIPFAYAIIMVAFLITFIAATSIITILTIVLTITGYTAYPITENTFNTSLAIGVVCASFALALVTASLVVWRRHCQAAYYYLDDPQSASRGTNSPQLSETYDDSEYGSIPVNDWAKHVQKLHVDGDIGFSREFEQIQKANNSNLTYDHSQLAENKHKNRYINIVAYDHTRVPLRLLPGQKKPGSDYINANFIDVSITIAL